MQETLETQVQSLGQDHLRHEGIRAGDLLRVSEAVEGVRKHPELAK